MPGKFKWREGERERRQGMAEGEERDEALRGRMRTSCRRFVLIEQSQ